jgi:hypothetical protein
MLELHKDMLFHSKNLQTSLKIDYSMSSLIHVCLLLFLWQCYMEFPNFGEKYEKPFFHQKLDVFFHENIDGNRFPRLI